VSKSWGSNPIQDICSLFAVYFMPLSISVDSVASNLVVVNDEFQRIWMEVVSASPRYYPEIGLVGLRQATKDFNKNNWCSGRDSNQAPTKYKCRVL
jgi:hypothetical protein